tara:strand:+ start:397 stop:789 length:393 start_codon:yes stop_codon:yes gene_type:complete
MKLEENNKIEELFIKGVEAFNSSDFYDAHEHWEDLWSEYRLPDAKFIQALIQLAVGYFHITNNNKNGALGLLKKCRPKFELYQPSYRGLDVSRIIYTVDISINNINKIDKINEFDWTLVPKLKIVDGRTV